MKTAFIGLGAMGAPMAGHLLAKGHQVTVYNRTLLKAQAWVLLDKLLSSLQQGRRACLVPVRARPHTGPAAASFYSRAICMQQSKYW